MNACGSALLLAFLAAAGCTAVPEVAAVHPGVTWVANSAEYQALARQAYRAATGDLAGKLADLSFSALPGQEDAAGLPPALILDVDETVVNNVGFQYELVPPFTEEQFIAWNSANRAEPVPGVVEFADAARDLGIALFFVTNRACEPDEAGNPCPQEAVTVEDIREAGIAADADRVMLSFERPEWNKEKKNRRDVVARDYRVLMLIGDDLNDFIPCSRARAVPPCAEGATVESRSRSVTEHGLYWGNGWYVLPNPMYGSWTTVLP